MTKGVLSTVLTGLVCVLVATTDIYAQYTIQHQAPTTIARNSSTELDFVVPGITQSDVQQAVLFYRYDGDFSYQQREVTVQSGGVNVLFQVNNQNASSVEYYLEITLLSGESIYYPDNLPAENPVEVQIVEEAQEEERERLSAVDFTILSPEPEVGVTPNDVVIAMALFYDNTTIEDGEFRLFLDNRDITADADTSAYYISYIPETIRRGPHTIRLDYVTEDKSYLVTEWNFFVVSEGEASFQGFSSDNIMPQGRVELTGRNQVIGGDPNNAITGRALVSGSYGQFRYSLNGFLTSQESSRLQPQNRYGVTMRLGKWWDFQAGHVYPTLSKFTISGRRIYGINSSLHLLWENLNFQFIYGELDRKITNIYSGVEVFEDTTSSGLVVDTTYTLGFESQGRGTFKREVIGGRVGLGNRRYFQLGFQALKVKDDTTSLYNVRDYYDLLRGPSDLRTALDPDHEEQLEANPDLLQVQGGSPKPRDNIVAGTDLRIGLASNRIRFESEAVVSALNNNIYGGPLTVERAEELGFDLDQDFENLLDELSTYIIVNENMSTLPLRIRENEQGESEAEPFFPTSILAGSSELSFNYPVNNFRVQYRWIGPEFSSLANSTVRKDVAGFTFTDRVSMFSNRLFLTLGYENLNDNVTNLKDATIRTITYRSNASWYPINPDLPRVSVGVRYRSRDNGIERFNPVVPAGLETAAVQNLRRTDSGDLVSTASPRRNNTINFTSSVTQQFMLLEIVHDATVSFSTLNTSDEVFAYGNVKNRALSFNLTSRFNLLPLRTQLGLTYNDTESGSGQSQINIFGMYLGGSYFMLDDKLNLNARLAFTSNESTTRNIQVNDPDDFDQSEEDDPYNDYYVLSSQSNTNDFGTYVFQVGAEYNLHVNHSLIFDANLTNVTGTGRENDRIVQLRYVFRF